MFRSSDLPDSSAPPVRFLGDIRGTSDLDPMERRYAEPPALDYDTGLPITSTPSPGADSSWLNDLMRAVGVGVIDEIKARAPSDETANERAARLRREAEARDAAKTKRTIMIVLGGAVLVGGVVVAIRVLKR